MSSVWLRLIGASVNTAHVDVVDAWFDLTNFESRVAQMTIPFGEPDPSDARMSKSVSSTRLRAWLNTRLRYLATAQRIQDARALRREFSVD